MIISREIFAPPGRARRLATNSGGDAGGQMQPAIGNTACACRATIITMRSSEPMVCTSSHTRTAAAVAAMAPFVDPHAIAEA